MALNIAVAASNFSAHAQPANVQPGVVEREYQDKAPPHASNVTIPSVESPRTWDDSQSVRFVLTAVNIEGNAVIDDAKLSAPFHDLIGKEVSIGQIFSATEQITRMYDAAGYALSLAYVPAQEVKGGVVLVRVVEGYIGDVAIHDGDGPPKERWTAYADRLKASRPLKTEALERYLLLVSDQAGVKATNFFERLPNADPGAMRLVMNIDRKRVDVHAEVNNRGSEAIGPIREYVNLGFNDTLGFDERISAFGVGALEDQELLYLGGRLDLPVSSEGTLLSFEAAHSATKPGTATLAALDFQGSGWTGSITATHALIRSIKDNLYLSFGLAYKNLKSRLSGVDNTHDIMTVVSAGADYDGRDRWGGLWHAVANVLVGLDVFDATRKSDPLGSRLGASGQFAKLEASISTLESISQTVSVYAELSGQVADGPLLVSEQCGYGGGSIGRAFDPFELTGDHCVKGRAELRFDMPVRGRIIGDILDSAQFYILADFGVMRKSGLLLPTEVRTDTAESAGLGFRFKTTNFLSGFVEVARPFDHGIAASGGARDTRVFFGISADY